MMPLEDYNQESYTRDQALAIARKAHADGMMDAIALIRQKGTLSMGDMMQAFEESSVLRLMHAHWCTDCGEEIENGDCTTRMIDGERYEFHRACAPPLTEEDCR